MIIWEKTGLHEKRERLQYITGQHRETSICGNTSSYCEFPIHLSQGSPQRHRENMQTPHRRPWIRALRDSDLRSLMRSCTLTGNCRLPIMVRPWIRVRVIITVKGGRTFGQFFGLMGGRTNAMLPMPFVTLSLHFDSAQCKY